MKFIVLIAAIASVAVAASVSDEVFDDMPEIVDDNSTISTSNAACQVTIGTHLGNPQPLYIRPGTSQFYHPSDRRGIIEANVNQEIELFCTGGFASPAGITLTSIRVACSSGVRFRFNNILYNMNEFRCRDWPVAIPRRRSPVQRCFNNAIMVDVGFTVLSRFLTVFSVCHDTVTEENYFTAYHFTPASDANERNVVRPSWAQSDFFPGKNVDNLHTRFVQRRTIGEILNSPAQAARWIEEEPSDIFLARGHMAAMTDFISANEQRSTFFFVNTAPQFQTFNSLNWVSVEISSRRLAADRNINLEVYTGTFGRGQLQDAGGTWRDIFLAWPQRQIPMPRLFYKILINRANRSGVVLLGKKNLFSAVPFSKNSRINFCLGVNNPHLTLAEILRDYVICTDVADRINYVTWQRTNLNRGYSYACEVNNFLSRVPHIPSLSGFVTSLLV